MYTYSKNIKTWSICYIFKMAVASGGKGKWYVGVQQSKHTSENWLFSKSGSPSSQLLLAGQGFYFPAPLHGGGVTWLSSPMECERNEASHMRTKEVKQWKCLPQSLSPFPSAWYTWALGLWKPCAEDSGAIQCKEAGSLHHHVECQPPTNNSLVAVIHEGEIAVSHWNSGICFS